MLSSLFGLILLPLTLAALSTPFCVLQLALCKHCKGRLLPILPLILSSLGLAGSCCYMIESSDIAAAAGLFVLFPSLLGLIGSGLGLLIWKFSGKHLC